MHSSDLTIQHFNESRGESLIIRRRGFFGYSVRDHGDVYWFANMTWDGETTRERHGRFLRQGPDLGGR